MLFVEEKVLFPLDAFRELIKINVRTDTYFYDPFPGRTRNSAPSAPVHGKSQRPDWTRILTMNAGPRPVPGRSASATAATGRIFGTPRSFVGAAVGDRPRSNK